MGKLTHHLYLGNHTQLLSWTLKLVCILHFHLAVEENHVDEVFFCLLKAFFGISGMVITLTSKVTHHSSKRYVDEHFISDMLMT